MAKKQKKQINKFEFGLDFQEAILNFVVLSKLGHKVINLIDDTYFTLLHHAIIFKAIKSFWKTKKKIISRVILKENLRNLYRTKEIGNDLLQQDKDDIDSIVDRIYNSEVVDPESILESIIKFSRYVTLKDLQERHNLEDYNSYDDFARKVQKAITIGNDFDDNLGHFLVEGARDRAYERSLGYDNIQTPWWQLNRLINGGSLNKGVVIMLMSKQKRFKTGMMLNWCKAEMGRRRRGFYVDLENGIIAITTRADQSVLKLNKQQVLEGEYDEKMLKTYRKYKRIKSELVIKRFPAYKTSTDDILNWVKRIETEKGIKFNYGVIDYGDLLSSTTGSKEDEKRISDAYIDMKNLASPDQLDLDYLLTASHVKRDKDTQKRAETKYIGEDVAKCVDKIRHCDIILGLQESEEEKEAGVMRVEIVDQRDGVSEGNMMFWVDIEKQLAKEFTHAELKDYNKQSGRDEMGKMKKAEKESDV